MGHLDNGVFDGEYVEKYRNETSSAYSHDERPDYVKLPLDFGAQAKPANDYQFTFWDMARSHQPLIVISVMIILVVGIFVSSFAYCIEKKKGSKPYGQAVKYVESDIDLDDQTDSELELIDDM